MRVKVSETLIAYPAEDKIVVYNYLTREAVTCDPVDVNWLTTAPYWKDVAEIVESSPSVSSVQARSTISELLNLGLMVEEGSPSAIREAKYASCWEMGKAAGFFHFHLQDHNFIQPDSVEETSAPSAGSAPAPLLFWKNTNEVTALPKARRLAQCDLYKAMHQRRTNRFTVDEPIRIEDVAECLYAGFGITGFVNTANGYLPLKLSPSGGARNPYEGYLIARRVKGIEPGVYHYSAINHSLQRISASQEISFSQLTMGQDWAEDMSAAIVMVASLERTTKKYRSSHAYSIVLIEAGHIAQNIMLSCASKGLTACPTAALAHTELSSMFGLTSITDTPLYALLLGKPRDTTEQIISVDEYLSNVTVN